MTATIGRSGGLIGTSCPPHPTRVRTETVEPLVHGDHVHGEIRMVDHFGNLALNLRRSDLGMEFLHRAVYECPTAICVMTKTDFYPHWRTIAIRTGHSCA